MEQISTIIPWVLSFLSLIIAAFTIHSNAKLHYFDVYFQHKVDAYKTFFSMSCAYISNNTSIADLVAAGFEVSLFGSSEVSHITSHVIERLACADNCDQNENPLDLIEDLKQAMQNDLARDNPKFRALSLFQRKR